MLWAVLSTEATAAADRAALARLARGEAEALGEIYDRHGRLVYSLAIRILRDQGEAEDIVQDVFAQAWRQASRYDPARATVLGWLLNLARSRSIDRLRARRARPEPTADDTALRDLPDSLVPADEQLAWAGQASQLRLAIDSLTVLQRTAIELAFYEGLTHAEVAERLELPLGTVKTRIRQGLLTLRDRLAGVPR
jgi:RNA polymerase sigma-70 factor (ECF subfamily)